MPMYPTVAASFPTRLDGDTIFAEHMNSVQGEISQITDGLLNGLMHDVIPGVDLGYSLGRTTRRWNNLFVHSVAADEVLVGGVPITPSPTLPINIAYIDVNNAWSPSFQQIFGNARLGFRDAGGVNFVGFETAETMTNNRFLRLNLGNANRTIDFVGSPTLGNWFNQDVRTTAFPTFAGVTTGLLTVNGFTVTVTAPVTLPQTLPANIAFTNVANTFTAFQTFNSALQSTGVVVPNAGLYIQSPTAGRLRLGASGTYTSDRALYFNVNDLTDQVITLVGSPTFGDWFDQVVKTTSRPTFSGIDIGGTGFGLLNINVNNNIAGLGFHYPGVVGWVIGRAGAASGLSFSTGPGGTPFGVPVLTLDYAPARLTMVGQGFFAPSDSPIDPGGGAPAGLRIGFNLTNDRAYIQAIHTGVAVKDIYFQEIGGQAIFGGAVYVNSTLYCLSHVYAPNLPTSNIGVGYLWRDASGVMHVGT
jgi:hypothetical protein